MLRLPKFIKEVFSVYDKKLDIQTNGVDNAYAERMELLRINSVTCSMASTKMVQFILGKGLGQFDNIVISGRKMIEVANAITRSVVDENGVFIQIDYNANLDLCGFQVLPFKSCRIGKLDSKDYNGKILYSKDWSDKKASHVGFDVYNPNKKVIQAQIVKAGSFEKYKGQIYFFNAQDNFNYPLARIHSVQNDCNSEKLIAVYKENLLKGAFFPRTLIVTRPLVPESFIINARAGVEGAMADLRQKESEREEYLKEVKGLTGVDNVGGVMTLECDFVGDDISKEILVQNLDSNIKPDLFEKTSVEISTNILMAYNNLPVSLVKNPDNSLFGMNGDALRVAKETYYENCTKERMIVETIVNDLLRNCDGVVYNKYINFLPLFTKEVDVNSAFAEKQKAQATLKGSVGGVTSLLEIIRTVSIGQTDYNSAAAIIIEIFGFTKETAQQLLGTPTNNLPANVTTVIN